eukprot:CAMPEP_0201494626 /NCGR_PEP_ID=MMETSP0151_2-20130828/48741_1 /ASSEMBLY_ACC=CAM_ASM_000257 /TAXON_ID=200890 /ORGANISM="Paramoeba atlantica, Strain 621/1 / CCAP 1560/9" /LENGTH=299 /DNA_ID=CAMNT_0047883017 /DNA_START=233 /DNA_END=1132 /DNA_ORIENTATION=+
MPQEGVELTPKEKTLTTEEIIRLSRLFVESGVDKIRLTGGEPTVRKDLVDIIGAMGQLPNLKQIGITSNGIVLKRKLSELKRVGLTHVNISLDTLDSDKFFLMTRRDGFKKVIEAIDEAETLGFDPVKINCVLMKGVNDEEIMDFVEMTKDRNIDVRFIEYMPFDGNRWSSAKLMPYLEVIKYIEEKSDREMLKFTDSRNETAKSYYLDGYRGRISFITSMTEHFCGTCNRLRITADGNLKVCLFGNHEINLMNEMREGVTDEGLREVIGAAVGRKKERHAGMFSISKAKNRPMILIGG